MGRPSTGALQAPICKIHSNERLKHQIGSAHYLSLPLQSTRRSAQRPHPYPPSCRAGPWAEQTGPQENEGHKYQVY